MITKNDIRFSRRTDEHTGNAIITASIRLDCTGMIDKEYRNDDAAEICLKENLTRQIKRRFYGNLEELLRELRYAAYGQCMGPRENLEKLFNEIHAKINE